LNNFTWRVIIKLRKGTLAEETAISAMESAGCDVPNSTEGPYYVTPGSYYNGASCDAIQAAYENA